MEIEFENYFKPYQVKITATCLNVREGPGQHYDVRGQVRKNEVYTVVEESNNGWGKIKPTYGWVSLNHCQRR